MMESNSAAVTRADAEALAEVISGVVLLPEDEHYTSECATFNLLTDVRPGLVVGAASAEDVQVAVRYAARRGRPVAVLGRGHQLQDVPDEAVLINLRRMSGVAVDAERSLARVEGGARWKEVVAEAVTFGLAPANGSAPTVGVAAYVLGGGQSPVLGRRYGFAADHVRSVELVTADGELRVVTADGDGDLFWALLGGKSNFGVVTALEIGLFPVSRFYGGSMFFDGQDTAEVLSVWRDWVARLPEEASSSFAFLRLPPLPEVPEPLRDTFVVAVRFSSLGSAEAAEELLTPIREVADPVVDMVGEKPYARVAELHMDPPTPQPWVDRAIGLREFPQEAADVLVTLVGPESGSDLGMVEIRAFGGALGRPPAVGNAVAGRNAPWAVLGFGFGAGGPEQIKGFVSQLRAVTSALEAWADPEIMTNFLSAGQGGTPSELRPLYGTERYERLARVKRRYDPDNVFRVNHNVAPSSRD